MPTLLSVAWWREHDPAYLKRLIGNLQAIQQKLPNPVPAGQDARAYFEKNYYDFLAKNPQAYGWYQIKIVLAAYAHPPMSYQQTLNSLRNETYVDIAESRTAMK